MDKSESIVIGKLVRTFQFTKFWFNKKQARRISSYNTVVDCVTLSVYVYCFNLWLTSIAGVNKSIALWYSPSLKSLCASLKLSLNTGIFSNFSAASALPGSLFSWNGKETVQNIKLNYLNMKQLKNSVSRWIFGNECQSVLFALVHGSNSSDIFLYY